MKQSLLLKITKRFGKPLLAAGILALFIGLTAPFTQTAGALSGDDFKAGRIIDDAVFYDNGRMTISQIQNFLDAKVPVCDTNGTKIYSGSTTRAQYGASRGYPTPYTCLKDYSQSVPTITNGGSDLCTGSISGGTKSAARIIYEVAQACAVNPQVLIVLLQKEQSLVTDDWPWSIQYRSATGYGCPDTAPCDSEYYGFFNQVYQAAKAYRRYRANPANYNYRAGRNNTILWHPNTACGSSNVFIENQATAGLYTYTPYRPNRAALDNLYGTGDSCSSYGNRNFWRLFNDWFGTTMMVPRAIKGPNSGTVYLHIDGKRFAVPSMAILQDFGIHPSAISTLSQSALDAIPLAGGDSGLSSSVGVLVKSPSDSDDDQGTLYFVSVGKRYAVTDMSQFHRFGFSMSDIRYIPLPFILSLPSGGLLSDFIASPTSNVFRVVDKQKRIIFRSSVYNDLNTTGKASFWSHYGVSTLPSGDPIDNNGLFVRKSNGAIFFYEPETSNYHAVPNMSVYSCLGVGESAARDYFQVALDTYIANPAPVTNLGCHIGSSGTSYLLTQGSKYSIPDSFDVTLPNSHADVLSLASLVPTKGPLSQAVKESNSATVWFIEDGSRKVVPSMSNLRLLGLNNSVQTLSSAALNAIPVSGLKLGNGQIVKSASSDTVYAIYGSNRYPIASAGDFSAFGYAWRNLETYPASQLNTNYPAAAGSLSRYVHDSSSNKVYLLDVNGCAHIPDALLAAYGKNKTTLINSQAYGSGVFPHLNLSECRTATAYIKDTKNSTVYALENGVKRPVSSWSKLVAHSGSANPGITVLSNDTVAAFTTGTTI